MARIRTIKPEFCTSEQVVECSRDARLLFICMWNFCDDGGVHPASLKRLKMEVFPGDDITLAEIQKLIDELSANGLIEEYESQDQSYWHVTGWDKHQKIEKPTHRWPKPKSHSSNGSRTIDDRSPPERNGTEGNGYGKETETDSENPLSGSYEEVTSDILGSPASLLDWFEAGKRFGVLGSDCDQMHIFGLAAYSRRKGKNPAALFVSSLKKANWKSHVTANDEREGERMLKSLKPKSTNGFAVVFQGKEDR